MGNRWGDDGPPPESYSRVTRDLDAVYDGLHDIARTMVDELCRRHDLLRVPMRSWWLDDPAAGGRDRRAAADLVAAWWLLPSDPRCLPAAVALLGAWDVRVRHTWFGGQVSAVGCTCDACDENLDEAADALDRILLDVVGAHTETVRRRLGWGRARWLQLEDAGSGSGLLVEPGDPMLDRLPGRASLSWPAWPVRGLRG